MKLTELIRQLKAMREESDICLALEDDQWHSNGLYGFKVAQFRDGIIIACGDDGDGISPSDFLESLDTTAFEEDDFNGPERNPDVKFFDGSKLVDFKLNCAFDNSEYPNSRDCWSIARPM